jgi:glucose-6-phosphate 1-dehydrogenase
MFIARYSIQNLMKLRISRQIFEEYSNKNFQENSSSGR